MRQPILPPPPKPRMKYVWVFLSFFFPIFLFSQGYEDVLYLKNGWILHGTLIGSASDSLVRIETHDRNVFVFPQTDILRAEQKIAILKTPPRYSSSIRIEREISYRNKGYFLLAQVGTMMGSASDVNNESTKLFNPHIINGYRFNRFVSAGAGFGINLMARGAYMPIFLDVRGDLLKQKMTPHYYANAGYSLPLFERDVVWGWWGQPLEGSYKAKGGLLLDGGAGIKIHTPSGFAWLLTGGYRVQQVEESYMTWGEVRITERYTFQRVSLQLGVMF
ncbi:MAG: hypothetical protein SF052_26550 [Bacteroidia bacterium]|nr:hypothetical protein [Bacteroidia bacterium]